MIMANPETQLPNTKVHHTIGTMVLPIIKTLQQANVDYDPILKQVGIPKAIIKDPYARIEMRKMTDLWNLAAKYAADEQFGFKVAENIQPATFQSLVLLHHASRTARDSLEKVIRFASAVNTSLMFKVNKTERDTRVLVIFPDDERLVSYHAMDFFVAGVYLESTKVCALGTPIFKTLALKRSRPVQPELYAEHFNCQVEFESNNFEIVFHNEFLDAPILTANAELARLCEQVLTEYLSRTNKDDIVNSVIVQITRTLSVGECSQEKVADQLGMSSRSLLRKLKGKNISYQSLLDHTRQQLALSLITDKRIPITNIGLHLGFNDSGSFSRSFKRWTGKSPRDYRETVNAQPG